MTHFLYLKLLQHSAYIYKHEHFLKLVFIYKYNAQYILSIFVIRTKASYCTFM